MVELMNEGMEVVILDNLANSDRSVLDGIRKITGVSPAFEEVDLRDREATFAVFEKYPGLDAVIHFAAFKAVGESVEKPLEYYENNLLSMIHLMEGMRRYGVPRMVFSSSCTVYGEPDSLPVTEQAPVKKASSPYGNTKQIPWDRVLHLATLDHIGQVRGVSEFASVINRLSDIKEYEESELVAAKIAAMLTGYIKKGAPDHFEPTESVPREISFQPGMVIDDLGPGEDVGMIDSNRPNPNLVTFRQGQLRAVAAGIGGSYSSISRDYDGTYSAQRQELVEQWIHYAVLTDEFTGEIIQPVWEEFVRACHLSGVVRIPSDCKPGTENDALYTAQSMPWIDPLKEANAWAKLVESGFASEVEAIRRRGANPADVLEQIAEFRRRADDLGVQLGTVSDSAPATE